MIDDTLRENNNLVSFQQTGEKQSLVKMNTCNSGHPESQYDINKKGRSGFNEAKDLLNNQVSAVVCSVPS